MSDQCLYCDGPARYTITDRSTGISFPACQPNGCDEPDETPITSGPSVWAGARQPDGGRHVYHGDYRVNVIAGQVLPGRGCWLARWWPTDSPDARLATLGTAPSLQAAVDMVAAAINGRAA